MRWVLPILLLTGCFPQPEDCTEELGLTLSDQNVSDDMVWNLDVEGDVATIDRSGSCVEIENCTFEEHFEIVEERGECPKLTEGYYRTNDPVNGEFEAVYDDSMLTLQDWDLFRVISGKVYDRPFYFLISEDGGE